VCLRLFVIADRSDVHPWALPGSANGFLFPFHRRRPAGRSRPCSEARASGYHGDRVGCRRPSMVRGAGTADGVHPVEARSQFAIASFTKTVIAAEIMRLSEKGLLRLSDPLSEHLPSDFHFDTNGATILNLLHMESGIPDPTWFGTSDAYAADPLREWTPEEVLATVPAVRSKPGDHYVYEDANYMLLSLVIKQTTGTSVAAALRSHVLADPRLSSMVYQPAERP
jgi:D-alanyl-D-alanine carboxypeptidase